MRPVSYSPAPGSGFWRDPFLWVALLLALAVRLAYNLALHQAGHPPSSFVIDESEYFGAAHMLAEGRGFSFFDTALWVRPPLYVMLLAATMRLWGYGYVPALVVQALLSAATLAPMGWLAYRLAGRAAARGAMALALLYLPLTLFAGLFLSETLFVLLFMLALAALVTARDAFVAARSRQAFVWTVASGLLLGLAALTRATALAFVPLAALWLGLSLPQRSLNRRLAVGGIVLVACALTLVPWIARNYAAYGRFVLVDTTSGYNLWLASVGVKDEERLQNDLRAIPNPADKQSYAYAQAFQNIFNDPGAFIAKGFKESLDLWRPLFSAEERQVRGYSLGRVPAWHLISLIVFDDLLYVAILVLAVGGFALAPPDPAKWLAGLWALLWVAMAFVFFAVTRFQLPVVAALIPWSGVGLATLRNGSAWHRRLSSVNWPARVASITVLLAIAVVIVPAIPLMPEQTPLGVQRWAEQAPYRAAEALLKEGEVQQAIAQYRLANASLPDTRYGLAAALLQEGQIQPALQQLVSNEPPDRFEPFIIKGEAARLSGDMAQAQTFFNARTVKVAGDEALEWAWDHLNPRPVDNLAIGSGLDIGYIRGFYAPETSAQGAAFRWTGEEAQVRGIAGGGTLYITWSGWRPSGLSNAQVTVSAEPSSGAAATFTLSNADTWVVQDLGGVGAGQAQATSFRIETNGFVGGGNDQRLLGVRVARIASGK